jgi:MFS transporter, DHA2 family, methylenomycin A resistance protein
LTLAFVFAGRDGAGSPVVVAAGRTAMVAAAALVVVERRHPWPTLPLGLFSRRRFTVANAVAGTMNLGTLGCVYLLTLYLQVVQHRSPLAAGLAMVPLFAPLSVVAPLSGRLAGRFGPRLPMASGLTIAACGLALLATAGRESGSGLLAAAFLLWAAGSGC